MNKGPHGNIYKKNGYYYVRIYYYVDGKRKSKDRATGIIAETSSTRKAKQQERSANRLLEEYVKEFTASCGERTIYPDRQMVASTVSA